MLILTAVVHLSFQRLFILISTIFLTSCYLQNETGSSSNSFESDLAPLLTENCATSGCHDTDTSSGGLNLETNETRLADDVFGNLQGSGLINTVVPEDSVLLTQASNSDETDEHGGGEIFSTDSDEYASLLEWITAGALNDDCTNVTHSFATDVEPVFASCNTSGCHDDSNSLDLTVGNAFSSIGTNESVDTDRPIDSDLLQYALGNNEHPPGEVFASVNDDDFRTVFCWIKIDEAVEN